MLAPSSVNGTAGRCWTAISGGALVMTDIGESCCYSIERWVMRDSARKVVARARASRLRTRANIFLLGQRGVHTIVNAAHGSVRHAAGHCKRSSGLN